MVVKYAALAALLMVAGVTAQPTAAPTTARPLGSNIAAFDGLTGPDLSFDYTYPTNASLLQQSNATSLGSTRANIVSRIFSLAACSSFLPHSHPGGSEFFFQRDGQATFNVLFNDGLLTRTLMPFETLLVPQGALHFFYNDDCSQSNIVTTLNSATPGFQGFYNGMHFFYNDDCSQSNIVTTLNSATPGFQGFYNGSLVEKLRTTVFSVADMRALGASGMQDSVLDRSRAFLDITNNCRSRCGLPPVPASTMAPTMATAAPTTAAPTTAAPTAMMTGPTAAPTAAPT
eukprot:CAMPEP_0206149704 /NCGR_PEP_ID=MMETSP1473-20131121/37924_1 /ASSEMBLY_ACC=CAM_ASM_001109 /TAXON_ID=1461547 /ORGANISM="Stichococcus sp, Strain RCC1054" /LENGTH=286 /DNA_ID=CAMNT_0053547185 /DNA_START=34 /DNA_END=890 /DNA_ORIENTATION=-